MRGLLECENMLRVELGITPAHAGLTLADLEEADCLGDHPRACGAYSTIGGISHKI